MKKKTYFDGLEKLEKTICDKRGFHKNTGSINDYGRKVYGCKDCTCLIYEMKQKNE